MNFFSRPNGHFKAGRATRVMLFNRQVLSSVMTKGFSAGGGSACGGNKRRKVESIKVVNKDQAPKIGHFFKSVAI